ncbi:MAG TPA: hypothetical protein V6C65_31480 [Allocoleopsis sp.]
MKLIGYVLNSTSIGFGLMFIVMNSACASEGIGSSAVFIPDTSTPDTLNTAQNAMQLSPDADGKQWQVSNIPIGEDSLTNANFPDTNFSGTESIAEAVQLENNSLENNSLENNPLENNQLENNPLENNQLENNQLENIASIDAIASPSPTPVLNAESTLSSNVIEGVNPENEPPFSMLSASELAQLAAEDWQVSPIAAEPTAHDAESTSEPVSESTSESRKSASSPWRFTFTPYGFVPLTASGSATIRDVTADIDLGLDEILNPLNFALAGRFEAWHGNLGLIFDGSYLNFGQDNSRSRDCRGCFAGILPSQIDTEVNVQYGQFDLGVGYRIATANPAEAATDFDLGPLVLDAIVGARIYTLYQEINLSTNLGTERNLDNSNVLIQPLVSGRFRWNVSPHLAGWVRGDLAGFGIGGTLMAASVTGGIDWMFSGNTSLLLAYRLSSLDYNTEVQGQDFDLNLFFQGPYMGVVFRF